MSGFDQVRFRGTLSLLANLSGMRVWLGHAGVFLKDFRDYAMGFTDRIKQATNDLVQKAGRPLVYLHSSSLRKEHIARDIAERDGITDGLVCVLTSVEPCVAFTVGPNRQAKKLELRSHQGKCLHQYFYLIDPRFGWLNVRLSATTCVKVTTALSNPKVRIGEIAGVGESTDNTEVSHEQEVYRAADRRKNAERCVEW